MPWFPGNRSKFEPLSQSEEFEPLTLKEQDDVDFALQRGQRWKLWTRSLLHSLLVLGIGMGLGFLIATYKPTSLSEKDMGHMMGNVGLNRHDVQYNGSLFKVNVYRQNPGPEVDAAWEALGVSYRSAVVPVDKAAAAGLTESHVQIQEKYGGGFPANVEGLHHLHCLNLVRKAQYWNYDYYHDLGEGAFLNDDVVLKAHVSHCLDIIRQQLMCKVDMGVLGQVWWDKAKPRAYPDFNTRHSCRDFEAVRKWAKDHQAPSNPPNDYLKPPRHIDVLEALP